MTINMSNCYQDDQSDIKLWPEEIRHIFKSLYFLEKYLHARSFCRGVSGIQQFTEPVLMMTR